MSPAKPVDVRRDRPGHGRVLRAQDPQRHARIPACPLRLKLALPGRVLAFPLMHNGDGHHVLADGQRSGESILSEHGYSGYGDYDGNRLGFRLAGKPTEPEDGADPVVVAYN